MFINERKRNANIYLTSNFNTHVPRVKVSSKYCAAQVDKVIIIKIWNFLSSFKREMR